MMTKQVYYDLREQLDQYSTGFPSTASGVELRILEKLFSEEEADLFLNLSMILEPPGAIAQRTGQDAAAVASVLDRMFQRGLVFRLKKGETVKYGAVPFVVGSFEYQLKDMDKEFAELFDQYFMEAFGKQSIGAMAPLRTVPVNKSIDHLWAVAPYEDLKAIIKTKDKIAVAKCICRVQQGLLGKECAQFYVDKQMARFISQEDALSILDKCEEDGLVPQPFISQDAGGMCNCCGDCCGILRSIKLHPKPAEKVLTNYYAEVAADQCSGCETCLDRCQMEAIAMGDDSVAQVDRDRCIGCGLCVTTCPSEALSLKEKPESERREPPSTGRQYFMQLAETRGKTLIPLSVIKRSQS
jgi:electron transport complex protein RnfB